MYERIVGIWIDHDQAQIVEVSESRQAPLKTIHSYAEPRHKSTGQQGVPLPGHLGCNMESRDRNRRSEEFRRFYDRVIEAIPAAGDLVIMGPGLAKREFVKRLRQNPALDARVLRVQTASKLSTKQIVAELRGSARKRVARTGRTMGTVCKGG